MLCFVCDCKSEWRCVCLSRLCVWITLFRHDSICVAESSVLFSLLALILWNIVLFYSCMGTSCIPFRGLKKYMYDYRGVCMDMYVCTCVCVWLCIYINAHVCTWWQFGGSTGELCRIVTGTCIQRLEPRMSHAGACVYVSFLCKKLWIRTTSTWCEN